MISLPAARTYCGRVEDENGHGVGGAQVLVLEPGFRPRRGLIARRDGLFSLRVNESDGIVLLARRSGLCSAATPLAPLGSTRVVMRVSAGLRFRPPDEDKWESIRIASSAGHWLPEWDWEWDDDDESFRFADLPWGTWRVELVGPFGVVIKELDCYLESGDSVELDLRR